MSNVVAALPCCCGANPCGSPCCDAGVTEFGIFWTGSFQIIFNACDCVADVPNFICPCYGSTTTQGGQIGRGRITRTAPGPLAPCGECGLELEAVECRGGGVYFCPCACQWEDPPNSGQFYTCSQVAPDFCGAFEAVSGVGGLVIDSQACTSFFRPAFFFGADQSPGGRWEVVVPIAFSGSVRNGCERADMSYCHNDPGSGSGGSSRVLTPGYDGVLYRGPLVQRCADGRVDLRSRVGSYGPVNVQTYQATNETLIWSAGTVEVT